MDFTQFVSMLEESGLFFRRADLLEDKFEGTMSQPLHDYLEEGQVIKPEVYGKELRRVKRWSFVNCWHMNDSESAAMWKLYSSSQESISLQSTYAKLRDLLQTDVYVGVVKYISYERQKIPFGNLWWPLMYKCRSFEHERELRAVCGDMTKLESAATAPEEGLWKQVDLTLLIENIFVSPTAKPWFTELVRRVLRTYRVTVPVRQSDLSAEPLYY